MTKLKLSATQDERPRQAHDRTARGPVYRDLVAYAELLPQRARGGTPVDPAKLVPPMLARFTAMDCGFRLAKRKRSPA